jgi:hypothetical protein
MNSMNAVEGHNGVECAGQAERGEKRPVSLEERQAFAQRSAGSEAGGAAESEDPRPESTETSNTELLAEAAKNLRMSTGMRTLQTATQMARESLEQ